MTDNIKTVIQRPAADTLVELCSIDLSDFAGPVLYFCSSSQSTTAVSFGGQIYVPIDFETSGFERRIEGALPQPHVKISNVLQNFRSEMLQYDNFLGARFRRTRTFGKFLDGQPDADSTMRLDDDFYRIDRKVHDNPQALEFELASDMDQAGKKLPGRIITQTTCMHAYRQWTPAGFDYSKADCPYAGGVFYDRQNLPTSPDHDQCSLNIRGCYLRFQGGALPIWAFPGVARARSGS